MSLSPPSVGCSPSSDAIRPLFADEWMSIQCDDVVFAVKRSLIELQCRPDSLLTVLAATDTTGSKLVSHDCNSTHELKPIRLDRSPAYVRPVLNFLRTGELTIDAGLSKRAVRLEAEYFGVDAVAKLLRDVEPEYVSATVDSLTEASDAINDADGHTSSTCTSDKRLRTALEPATCTRMEIAAALRTLPVDAGLRLRGTVLNRVSFAKLDLRNSNFELCQLQECDFTDADVSRCNFSRAVAKGSTFRRAVMTHAMCLETCFDDCCFEQATCTDSNFSGSSMVKLEAMQADFSRCVMIRCNLSFANLRGTVLHQTQMRFVKLDGVERTGTSISMGGVIA